MTWIGTIWSAKIATNRKLRPGNFIHANAYAAIVAMLIGISTAGIVMMNELMKYVAKFVSEPFSTVS